MVLSKSIDKIMFLNKTCWNCRNALNLISLLTKFENLAIQPSSMEFLLGALWFLEDTNFNQNKSLRMKNIKSPLKNKKLSKELSKSRILRKISNWRKITNFNWRKNKKVTKMKVWKIKTIKKKKDVLVMWF